MTQYWMNLPLVDGDLPEEIINGYNKIIRSIDMRIYKPYECSKEIKPENSYTEYWIGSHVYDKETNELLGKCEVILGKEYDEKTNTYSYKLVSYEGK